MSNPSNEAVLKFLAATSPEEIAKLTANPETFADYLTEEWRRDPESLDPDSEEAAEAAEVDADDEEESQAVWVRLSPQVREKVLAGAKLAGADEELASDLNWALKEAQFDKEIKEIEEAAQNDEKWEAYKKAHPET